MLKPQQYSFEYCFVQPVSFKEVEKTVKSKEKSDNIYSVF